MPPSQAGSEEEMDEERRQAVTEALVSLSQQVAHGSQEAVPVTSQEVEEMLQEMQEARLDKLSMAAELLIKASKVTRSLSSKQGKMLLDAVQENIEAASGQAMPVHSPAHSTRASSRASSRALSRVSSRASSLVIPAPPHSGISATVEAESRQQLRPRKMVVPAREAVKHVLVSAPAQPTPPVTRRSE